MGRPAHAGANRGLQHSLLSCAHTSQLVKQCNEGAHKMERTEQMYMLHTQLDFSKVKVSGPRRAQTSPHPAV